MESQARRQGKQPPPQVLQQIRLSGVVLEFCGGWRLGSGSKFHQSPEDSGAHREELRLDDIRVIFLHEAREWRVLDPNHESRARTATTILSTEAMAKLRPRTATMALEAQEFVKVWAARRRGPKGGWDRDSQYWLAVRDCCVTVS